MAPAPSVSLAVFDLDGTLVDSRADLTAAANRLVVELDGVPLDERTLGSMIGDGTRILVERALAAGAGISHVDDSTMERFTRIYGTCLLDRTRPYHGIHPLLRTMARRIPLAVLTNKPVAPAREILAGLDLAKYFGAVIGGDGPFPRKPDPSSLVHLAREADVDIRRCAMIGDTRVDLETARRAGARVCLARYGFGYDYFPESSLRGDEMLADSPTDIGRLLAS